MRIAHLHSVIEIAPMTGFRRPQRQSRYGLKVGVVSDAS
jgi:hypothetical protein